MCTQSSAVASDSEERAPEEIGGAPVGTDPAPAARYAEDCKARRGRGGCPFRPHQLRPATGCGRRPGVL